MARAARRRGRRRRRRRHEGGRARAAPTGCRDDGRRRARRPRDGPRRAANVRPGDRVLVSGTIGDHGFSVLVARGDLKLETLLESDCAPARARRRAARARHRRSAGCATRHAAGSRRRSTSSPPRRVWRSGWTSGRSPSAPRSPARARSSGIDPLYVANEGKLVGASQRKPRTPRSPPSAPSRSARDAALIGEVQDDPPRPRPPRHHARREPHRRHARRRPAPPHLLSLRPIGVAADGRSA